MEAKTEYEVNKQKRERGRETFVPEDGGAGVAEIGVDELSRDNPMAVEGLAVGEMGIRLAGIRRSIVPGVNFSLGKRQYTLLGTKGIPAAFCQFLLCEFFEFTGLWR